MQGLRLWAQVIKAQSHRICVGLALHLESLLKERWSFKVRDVCASLDAKSLPLRWLHSILT